RAASAEEYAGDVKPQITGTIQMGQTSIATDNTRDTLLILAGARLRLVSPERYEKYQDLLAKWKIGGTVIFRPTNTASAPTPEVMAISKRMGTMRGLPTDADRSALVKTLVPEIAALPPQQKLGLIRSMASVSTEGDLGKDALGMVAVTLAGALRESAKLPGSYGDSYIELAKLVRYERLEVPSSPGLDAAQAVLELRERVQQENGFTLTSLDGKTYTLDGLRGKIVLLNFWATWCPPCRKEMPDMEKLYRTYEKKGLTVIAVSDEDRETVANFMAKNNYTFPIALDPGRKVNLAFSVEGIPKSFIFDREGRLAAQAIDMRTEAQFMELLKLAGLEE
ncbi:MAG: Redoxin domain protein, partial [Candidatus Solibacter sp.]|nr:Redoxin domain protein [Candidatus Solibacter sp.]